MVINVLFAHPGPHTTEGASHFLSGWHILLLLLGLTIALGLVCLSRSPRATPEEITKEQDKQ